MSSPQVISAIEHLGGHSEAMVPTERTEEAWARYLLAVGVKYFTAGELCAYAESVGERRDLVVPPLHLMAHSAAVLLLADEVRRTVGSPVRAKWLYRGEALNARRKGAKDSDHVSAAAVDLLVPKEQIARVLVGVVYPLYATDWLEVAHGVDWRGLLHVGLLAGRGQRVWTY